MKITAKPHQNYRKTASPQTLTPPSIISGLIRQPFARKPIIYCCYGITKSGRSYRTVTFMRRDKLADNPRGVVILSADYLDNILSEQNSGEEISSQGLR